MMMLIAINFEWVLRRRQTVIRKLSPWSGLSFVRIVEVFRLVRSYCGIDFVFGHMQIFMISLERRPERRNRMLACLEQLQLNFTLFDAVDGKYVDLT